MRANEQILKKKQKICQQQKTIGPIKVAEKNSTTVNLYTQAPI